jgi:mxaJ protein
MFSRSLNVAVLALTLVAGAAAAELRVCADPDSLPSSNRQLQGYENRIAALVARDMNARLVYEWQRLGRGFVRDILNKGRCDVLLGIPTGFPRVLTTDPYYSSTYVFVTRHDRQLHLKSFDDPALRNLKIGVQVLREEYAPPGQALGRRGLVGNIVGFETPGESPGAIVNAVLRKSVDAAVVWGPQAGYYARTHRTELEITPTPPNDAPALPMEFSISMGVRSGNHELRNRLNAVLHRRKPEIDGILRSYGVPLVGGKARAAD